MSCLLWLVFPFLEFLMEEKNNSKSISYKFFIFISLALLQSNYFNFLRSIQIILFLTNFTQKLLYRYEKVTPFIEFSVNGKKSLKRIATSLKSWMHSTSQIEVSKNCSRIWLYLTLSPFVSRKQTHTNKLRLQCGSGSMCPSRQI